MTAFASLLFAAIRARLARQGKKVGAMVLGDRAHVSNVNDTWRSRRKAILDRHGKWREVNSRKTPEVDALGKGNLSVNVGRDKPPSMRQFSAKFMHAMEAWTKTSRRNVGMTTPRKDDTDSGSVHLDTRAEMVPALDRPDKSKTKHEYDSSPPPPLSSFMQFTDSSLPGFVKVPDVDDPEFASWQCRLIKNIRRQEDNRESNVCFGETKFRLASEEFSSARRKLQLLYKEWLNDRVPESRVQAQHEKCVFYSSKLLKMFAIAMNIYDWKYPAPLGSFDKKKCDEQMEICFGSADMLPSYIFRYPGLKTLDARKEREASKIFSFYLSRKVFINNNPLDIEKKDKEFLNRVAKEYIINEQDVLEIASRSNSVRDVKLGLLELCGFTPARLLKLDRARKIMKSLVDSLFTHENAKRYPRDQYYPNSGKACVEVPLSKGGKRAAIYLSDASYQTDAVHFHTIVSGGKFRTITTDSAKNAVDFEFLNDYMFQIIRKLPCMISGRDVEDWTKDAEFNEWALSGDLEAATDNFDSGLAEIVIDRLDELFFNSSRKEDMYGFTTRAKFFGLHQQTNGQLMGSILSFPILCLINLVSNLIADDIDHLIIKKPKKIWTYRGCGINGDDVVKFGKDRAKLFERWCFGVSCVGGVPSRGKSLLSNRYFTVNSELFTVKGKPLNAIRPSLITAITDGAWKAPDKSWATYFSSSSWSAKLDKLFRPEDVLFPDFPVSWGGTRSKPFRDYAHFKENLHRHCILKCLKPINWTSFTDEVCIKPGVMTNGASTVVYLGGELNPPVRETLRSGFVDRQDLIRCAKEKYGVKKLVYWTASVTKTRPRAEVLMQADDLYRSLTEYEILRTWNRYLECWHHEEEGRVFAKNVPLDVIPSRYPERQYQVSRPMRNNIEDYEMDIDNPFYKNEKNENNDSCADATACTPPSLDRWSYFPSFGPDRVEADYEEFEWSEDHKMSPLG